MFCLYNISVYTTGFFLKIVALFNKKIRLFTEGRKETFGILNLKIKKEDRILWFHCASLGEFEQGRPLIEAVKEKYPAYKILLTFFSPSGYEVQKNYAFADVVTYLPLDTKKNVKRFLDIVHPEMVFFIKYEFWPNILRELLNRNTETLLISGVFRKDQAFFKFYGGWMRRSLKAFSHFFVQNKESEELLQSIGLLNVTISGDTRFDRVSEILKQDNSLGFIENFKQNKYTLVAGSTWPSDEKYLINYINNQADKDEKIIIAPHNIKPELIADLKKKIKKKITMFSDKVKNNEAQVFIVDTVGILTKVFSYADAAYIGGGFDKEGVHNVLEPATFGLPVIIGPVYSNFKEAVDLVELGGCKVVKDQASFNKSLKTLYADPDYRKEKGNISKAYILKNVGATKIILDYVAEKI
ncbi:MAG: 3-deoxy-D-manno-octulosonic acid transferase [Flavobacteriia bacterium]|nr:MAG: 3-deoxy-D-manno-octulosonic acid transferase [Flavobacteriia bacterium]